LEITCSFSSVRIPGRKLDRWSIPSGLFGLGLSLGPVSDLFTSKPAVEIPPPSVRSQRAIRFVGESTDKAVRPQSPRDSQRLTRLNPAEDNNLVNHVDDDGSDEETAYVFPARAEQFEPMTRIRQQGPTIGRATGSCVANPPARIAREQATRRWMVSRNDRGP
jgi:hypothetical protein